MDLKKFKDEVKAVLTNHWRTREGVARAYLEKYGGEIDARYLRKALSSLVAEKAATCGSFTPEGSTISLAGYRLFRPPESKRTIKVSEGGVIEETVKTEA